MLTEEEKAEMLADAGSASRRADFRAAQAAAASYTGGTSLDRHIRFLDDIQAVFGPFDVSEKPVPAHNNKL